MILTKSPVKGSLCRYCKLSIPIAEMDFGPGAFSPGIWRRPLRPSWKLPWPFLVQTASCNFLPLSSWQGSCGERLQSKCQDLPGCAWPDSLQGPSGGSYCHPDVAASLGDWKTRCFIHSPAGGRTVQLQFCVSKHTRWHGQEACCPVSSAGNPLPGDREGREGR